MMTAASPTKSSAPRTARRVALLPADLLPAELHPASADAVATGPANAGSFAGGDLVPATATAKQVPRRNVEIAVDPNRRSCDAEPAIKRCFTPTHKVSAATTGGNDAWINGGTWLPRPWKRSSRLVCR